MRFRQEAKSSSVQATPFLNRFFRLMIIFINDQPDMPVVDMKQRRKRKKTVTVFGTSSILSGVLDV